MTDKYILKGKEVIPEPNLMKWGQWLETAERNIKKTIKDGVMVSTVFLGLDHSFNPEGPPILFETMVFGGEYDQEQYRYSTFDEAIEDHDKIVAKVFGPMLLEDKVFLIEDKESNE